MQLHDIDKSRYRRHLNWTIAGSIALFAIASLSVSQVLIALFPDQSGSHFHWNLLGVILSAALVAAILNHYRNHSFMTEVLYVWELKQSLNKINRKMPKLLNAAKQGNKDAMTAIHFSYQGSRQLWQLDDNTLMMDELSNKQTELENLAEQNQVTLDHTQYNETLLSQF